MAVEALGAPKGEDADAGGEKVLILISSLLAWDATPKKLIEVRDPREVLAEEQAALRARELRIQNEIKLIREERQRLKDETAAQQENGENQDKEEVDDENAELASQNNDQADRKEAIKRIASQPVEEQVVQRRQRKFIHNAFTEADFAMRKSSAEYAAVREAEDLVLNFKRENVKTYVIASGVLYGKGEAILNDHFKKAWLQDPLRLPIVGSGNNLVPTVHVTDLARMVKKIYETKPERQYIFGIDNTKKPTQKQLV